LLSESAPAKLNLYLHVVGRRADGYHQLDSLVGFADMGDVVTARPAPDLSLAVTGPFAAALAGDPHANLVWRAAMALAARAGAAPGSVPGAALTLEKHLPIASGIGGGSSDAAATLRVLARLWELDIGAAELARLGAGLGADVPVCLAARTAWLGGIGEAVEPAPPLPPVALVLANPGVALATPAVFAARRGAFSAPGRAPLAVADAAALAQWLAPRHNDLTAAAIGLVPAIGEVLAALAAARGSLIARMSGSGATCFALFDTSEAAAAAAAELAASHPGWWVKPGRLI
jgi:4-diphosphocytidyl-2-C-methyl-D-erythritol kinase